MTLEGAIGLVAGLVEQGEEVIYFCTEEYRERIENTGATFKNYSEKAISLKDKRKNANIDDYLNLINQMLNTSEKIIQSILEQIKDIKFDYVIHSSNFLIGNIVSQILKIPSISSFAIFATMNDFSKSLPSIDEDGVAPRFQERIKKHPVMDNYKNLANRLKRIYNVKMPTNIIDLLFSKGDLNIAYTSEYFVPNIQDYDDSFIFIGPPIYDRKENMDFSFEKLKNNKVVYISLGTSFNNTDDKLYDIFFKTFSDLDVVVVMAAYNIDISKFDIPENFIVRNYVPQSEVLKYTDVAITHAGMNSASDLLYNNIPFVAIPIGADQPIIAARTAELEATISLDKDTLTSKILKDSVDKVMTNPKYRENIKKIGNSFKEAGGYKKAIKEICKFKKEEGIFS